jgi:benzoyl-CoA reductase/2-hydroxyglutaryl-CoA dehydratase subunit BcrC/BadD/HgdB
VESSRSIGVKVFAEYYHAAAEAREEGKPIAYVTAFTPVEILRAMGLVCLYPESYAVVCAASGRSTEMIQASGMEAFAQDLCSYSLLSFGAERCARPPFQGLPPPDVLIASNNQCGTTMLWFRLLAQEKNIPLFIIDYPAAADHQRSLTSYIRRQYEGLAEFIKAHTGSTLSTAALGEQVERSKRTCKLWRSVHEVNQARPVRVEVQKLIDALFPIVVARGTQQAHDYYEALLRECSQPVGLADTRVIRLLWHGYPMWFLPRKFPRCGDAQFQIVLNDYTLWWCLRYPDTADDMEALAVAYSDTYLNRTVPNRVEEVAELVRAYSIDGVICHANRSCRRALADIDPLCRRLHQLRIPSVVIEADMANPQFHSAEQVQLRMESLCDALRVP